MRVLVGSSIMFSAVIAGAAPATINVSSPAFLAGGAIPVQYTCDGAARAPTLTLSGVPANAQSVAILVDEPDAKDGPFTHMLVTNLPPDQTTIDLGAALPWENLSGLISLFLVDAENQLAEIARLQDTGDIAGIGRQAHMLVSAAGNMGALETSALAREVEHLCRSGNRDGLDASIADLREACGRASAAIRAWSDTQQAQKVSA